MSFIEIGGVATRYVLQGQAAPLLVLIHEMGGSLDSWDDVVERLQENWRVLRYDVRGAGLSEKLKGDVTVDVLAGDLIALLDALDIQEPICLAGSAVGAAIAFAALHRPASQPWRF
jgi:3-oxoadipate enol-lactonase